MKLSTQILNILLIISFSIFMLGIFALFVPGFGNIIKEESLLSVWLQGIYIYNIFFGLGILLIALLKARRKK